MIPLIIVDYYEINTPEKKKRMMSEGLHYRRKNNFWFQSKAIIADETERELWFGQPS